MASMRLDFVSQDHMVFSGDVTEIMAPGIEGELGILPRHAPLITVLAPGEVQVKREGQDDLFFAVSGGWMEVLPNQVTILARTAERSDEIDLKRAEEARIRAEELAGPRRRPAGPGGFGVADSPQPDPAARRAASGWLARVDGAGLGYDVADRLTPQNRIDVEA